MKQNNGQLMNTRYYLDDYERNVSPQGLESYTHYIYGGDGLCAIMTYKPSGFIPISYYYVYKDHLGSLLTLTDANGNIVEERNFDAWGRNRNPSDWSYNNVPSLALTSRGFTGHEHMEKFGLVNMNARLYDPVVGRMLSADEFIHGGTQGYNRYTYALNNPLSYVDPDGNHPIIIAMVAAAVIGGAMNLAMHDASGQVTNFWQGLKFFGIGALAGAASAYVGGIAAPAMGAATGFSAGLGTGLVAGAAGGAGNAALTGGSVFEGAVRGSVMGGVTGGVTGGLFSGLEALSYNRNFFTGQFSNKYMGLTACNDCGCYSCYHFPEFVLTANRVMTVNPLYAPWMWPGFNFKPTRSTQNGGYMFTSNTYSSWASKGREPRLRNEVKHLYGIVKLDEMLIPNGGGSGGFGQWSKLLDRLENFSNAADQMHGIYDQIHPMHGRQLDTTKEWENWIYHEELRTGTYPPPEVITPW